MSIITTMGELCILKCDGFDCDKRVESWNEEMVKNVALLSEWKNTDYRWVCPDCAEKEEVKRRGRKQKRSILQNGYSEIG